MSDRDVYIVKANELAGEPWQNMSPRVLTERYIKIGRLPPLVSSCDLEVDEPEEADQFYAVVEEAAKAMFALRNDHRDWEDESEFCRDQWRESAAVAVKIAAKHEREACARKRGSNWPTCEQMCIGEIIARRIRPLWGSLGGYEQMWVPLHEAAEDILKVIKEEKKIQAIQEREACAKIVDEMADQQTDFWRRANPQTQSQFAFQHGAGLLAKVANYIRERGGAA